MLPIIDKYNDKLRKSNSIYRLQAKRGQVHLVDVQGGMVQDNLVVSELEDFIDEVIEAEQSCL